MKKLRVVIEAPVPDETEQADAKSLVHLIETLALTQTPSLELDLRNLKVFGKVVDWELV